MHTPKSFKPYQSIPSHNTIDPPQSTHKTLTVHNSKIPGTIQYQEQVNDIMPPPSVSQQKITNWTVHRPFYSGIDVPTIDKNSERGIC
jgi:hypothetical protein